MATLHKGQRVVAVGVLKQRRWETQDGQKRSKLELVADEVGTSVLFAGDENGGNTKQPRNQNNNPSNGNSWNNTTPGNNGWNTSGFNTDDEPPF